MADSGEFVPCGRARRKERHVAHRWTFQAEDDSPAQAEATCPGYGDRERIADLVAERQEVIDCVNIYGDETLHAALDAIGFAPRTTDHSGRSEPSDG